MKIKIARIFSTIFIPPVNLLILFYYLSAQFETDNLKSMVVFASALFFGFLLPVSFFFFLRRKNKIVDNDATNKSERNVPYLFGIITSVFALVILIFFGTSKITIVSWGIYSTTTLALLVINRYWKISAHALGAAVPAAIILYFNISYLPEVFIILVIVSWSRIELKCHTIPQVLAGTLLGIFISLITLYLFKV